MRPHVVVAAILSIWDQLPELVGPGWPERLPRLLVALQQFAEARDESARQESATELEDLLYAIPNVAPALEEARKRIVSDRDAGGAAKRPWLSRLLGRRLGAADVQAQARALVLATMSTRSRIWGYDLQAPASDIFGMLKELQQHVDRQTILLNEQSTRSNIDYAIDPPAEEPEERVVNTWVEGLAADEPLELGTTYGLLFDVGPRRNESRVTEPFLYPFPSGEQHVKVQVLITTDDFIIKGDDQQMLHVPRVGPAHNQARFDIEPKRRGEGVIKAFLIAHNRVFQKLTLTFQVGPVPDRRDIFGFAAVGIALEAAMQRPARAGLSPINLMIVQQSSGYQFVLQGGGVRRAFLRVSVEEIAGWLKYARGVLHDIVNLQDADGNYLYQAENTTIAPDICVLSLKELAGAGIYLFDELFYGNSGPDARAMGDLLKKLSRQRQLKIQIVAEKFFFPWSLLYDGDDPDNPDPKEFWGFKHIIEYMPEFGAGTPVHFIPTIEAGDTLDMAFVCNNAIDTQFGRPIVQGQRETFHGLPGVSVKDYSTVQHLVDLMKDPNAPPLIYFYCHAVSKFPHEDGGVDDSKIALTDTRIALRDLKIKARTALPPLARAPLIFLNACESAELSPYLYDGLVPYMIARGVRGVIGTEVETPALFAAEFAKEFMRRFTAGDQPLGELLLDMRREYLEHKNNVMGLVYALYSSGDIVVRRGRATHRL